MLLTHCRRDGSLAPLHYEDLVGQYIAWTRLDAGVGLLLAEVSKAKADDSTLVIFFSDNGHTTPASHLSPGGAPW